MKSVKKSTVSMLLAVIALSCVSCSESSNDKPKISEAQMVTGVNPAKELKVEVNTKEPYGTYLTDSKGRALYLFTADSKMNSACYDACAAAWPPALTEDKVFAGDKVNASMLSTFKRKDGKKQAAYNGWPLYYYVKDKAKGDVIGQDIHSYGGEWYLISPKGNKIEAHKEKKSS